MQISAILLARAIAFIETNDLNPRGKAFFPDLVSRLVTRFGFLKYPQSASDFDESNGVKFEDGHSGDTTIDKIVVYHNGIQIDTRSSTEESQKLLDETLSWLRDETGITYETGMIKRWGYLSQISFHSEANLDFIHPAIANLCGALSDTVSEIRGTKLDFGFAGLSLSFDRWHHPLTVANFQLQRRVDAPFSDNKYYSEAPLQTNVHINLLERFETEILKDNPVKAVESQIRSIRFEDPRK